MINCDGGKNELNIENKMPDPSNTGITQNLKDKLIHIKDNPSLNNLSTYYDDETHPSQSVDCVPVVTNTEILEEVKNIARLNNRKSKVKCDVCDCQKLTITNGIVKNFVDGIFEHTNCLTELNLSNCNIEKFPEVIIELVNLSELNLSYNKLQTIPNSCILLKKLRHLNLSNNQIGYESPKCLELGLDFVTHLNLGNNLICTFNSSPKCLMLLQYLNLSHNYLEHVPKWLFSEKCRSLLNLDFSFSFVICKEFQNRVQESKFLRTSFLKSVKSLVLTNCDISVQELDVIKHFENINCLNVGNEVTKETNKPWKTNIIWDLPIKIFSNPEKITELQIYNTGISTLPNELNLFKNLKVLNASHNNLTWLPESIVELANLEVINLTSNKMANLPAHFSQMVSVKELYLSSNNLSNLDKELQPLNNLEVLDLYNNHLEEMPISDKQLKRLVKCDVSYNYFSVEEILNHNFEDGGNVLEVYKTLEENLRSSLDNAHFRNQHSHTRSRSISISSSSSDDKYSEISNSSYNYSGDYENNDCENQENGIGETNDCKEIVEENWDEVSDDDFFEPCKTRPKINCPALKTTPYSQVLNMHTNIGYTEHFFLPSTQHVRRIRKCTPNFNAHPEQFRNVD